MPDARRARGSIIYKERTFPLINLIYTDNSDKTDDISVSLADREGFWQNEGFPNRGDKIAAAIEVEDWRWRGDNRAINLGEFEIANVNLSDIMTLSATAVPINGNVRGEKKNRGWRSVALSRIAADIAGIAGLRLVYETDFDPFFNDKSDFEFLEKLCSADGLCMKITDGQLIIYEQYKYEAKPAIATLTKGQSNIIGNPNFNRNLQQIYTACEIAYFDPRTDQTRRGFFRAPNVEGESKILRLRENAGRHGADVNLDRRARTRLREQNKDEWTCAMAIVGDLRFFAGINLEYDGWGKYDGKYHVYSCEHSIDQSGYRVLLNSRRALEGY